MSGAVAVIDRKSEVLTTSFEMEENFPRRMSPRSSSAVEEVVPTDGGPLTNLLKTALENLALSDQAQRNVAREGLWRLALLDFDDKEAMLERENENDPISSMKVQESAILALMKNNVDNNMQSEVEELFVRAQPVFASLPKAKTAKIIRQLVDLLSKMDGALELQEKVCLHVIEWTKVEKRTFLRHRVETRLAAVYLAQDKINQGLRFIAPLLSEVKKIDDKVVLVEIHLIESKMQFAVKHLPRAKAALTACRTIANSVNIAPLVLAEIDLHGGVLLASERDYRTAFSYFVEAFEAFTMSDDPRAIKALKYMILMKLIGSDKALEEVTTLSVSRNALRWHGPEIEAVLAVAKCHKEKTLKAFEAALAANKEYLQDDEVFSYHLGRVKEQMLEQNILQLLSAYSRIDITYISHQLMLPEEQITRKVGEMILDKKLHGTMDQALGLVVLYEKTELPSLYEDSLKSISNLNGVVDILFKKADKAMQL